MRIGQSLIAALAVCAITTPLAGCSTITLDQPGPALADMATPAVDAAVGGCGAPADCPAPADPCLQANCVDRACIVEDAPAGRTCGASAACDGSGHCLVTLASGLQSPTAIAVDSTDVYWVNWAQNGSVMRCAKGGCRGAPTTLAAGEVYPVSLAVDGAGVYWTINGINGVTDSQLRRCGAPGCLTPETLLAGPQLGSGLALDAGTIYFTENAGDGTGRVMSCAPGGCGSGPTQLAFVDGVPSGIAAGGGRLAWGASAVGAGVGHVAQCSLAACVPTEVAANATVSPRAVAVDALNAYWTNADFTVRSCALAGCADAPPALASFNGNDIPDAIATDGVNVYWTVIAMGGTPSVMKCPVGGCDGRPITVASGPAVLAPEGIAVDGTSVYWTDNAAGTVMKTAK